MNIKLGRDTFSIPITRAKNSVTYSRPDLPLPKEVMPVSPFETPESSLDKDTESFIREEDKLGETIELPEDETPPKPPVELQPLPAVLRYAFLNGNKETPVIICDKLSDEESNKLIAVLEKHSTAFGYSLQDLKGISPTLYTHRILSRILVRGTLTGVHDEIARTKVEASNSTLYPVTRTVLDDRNLKDGKGVE